MVMYAEHVLDTGGYVKPAKLTLKEFLQYLHRESAPLLGGKA